MTNDDIKKKEQEKREKKKKKEEPVSSFDESIITNLRQSLIDGCFEMKRKYVAS